MRLITRALGEEALRDPYADPDSPPTVVDFGPPPPPDPSAGSAGMLGVGGGGDQNDLNRGPVAEPAGSMSRFDSDSHYQNRAYSPASEQLVEMGEISRFEHGESMEASSGQPVALDEHGVGVDERVADGSVVDLRNGAPVVELDGVRHDWTADGKGRNSAVIGADRYDSNPTDWSNPPNQPLDLSAARPNYGTGGFGDVNEPPPFGEPTPDQSYSPAATFVETDTLRLQIDGEDYVFLPGHEVTIGRDPSCLVTVDERHSLVSRRHLRFVHSQGTWWLEDASSKGTYIDGRRLNRPYKVEGAFIAQLGDPSAGTQLRVVTAGQHRQPTNRAGLAIAVVAATALVIAAVVAWLVLGGDEGRAEALATAKQSTVMLLSESGHGSGFFVSKSMIVTNQHVAAMADQLVVAVSPEVDEPAEIRYVASLVENHPFLDIAVVRITNEAAVNDAGSVTIGDPADSADVPLLQLGDSSAVTIGDPVSSIGFPGRFSVSNTDDAGNPRLSAVTSTSGQAANFTSWPGCTSPNLDSFIPPDSPPTVTCSAEGNIDKGVLLASFPSGQGASGSAVLHDDKVVAVLFAGDSDDSTASRSITTNAFSGWLSSVLALAE
ncbi:MAG: trypsin-like peptidase domain-containing protein [Acidimicrobiia bacterium]|nr:trypsin-like peptidase domain-containing protein [Acidimicrobiia bacterium]